MIKSQKNIDLKRVVLINYQIIVTVVLSCVLSLNLYSQPLKNYKHLKNLAENAEYRQDYYSAIDYYSEYLSHKPKNDKIRFSLAKLYLKIRDYENAEIEFRKVFNSDNDEFVEALYYNAIALQSQERYDEAINVVNEFLSRLKKDKDLRTEYKKKASFVIDGCNLAKSLKDSSLDVEIIHLDTSINRANIEFSPIIIDENNIIYASLESDTIVYYKSEEYNSNIPVRKFYTATKNAKNWQKQAELDGPFNVENENTGNGVFSADGKKFFFTRCKTNYRDKIICNIYVSNNENGKWSEPVRLEDGINIGNATSTHPAIAYDSKTNREIIYFVSDRKGGKGGMDIWYSQFDPKKKNYKKPKNLGSTINTANDEVTPFYDLKTSSLYYSSNGKPGMGGFDIFRTIGEKRKWLEPQNVGYPLNSGADDIYYVCAENKESGFFTSNRKGSVGLKHETCCDDLYSYNYVEYKHLAVRGNVFGIEDSATFGDLNGNFEIISDESSGKQYLNVNNRKYRLMDKAIVKLFYIDPKTKERVFITADTTSTNGEYLFDIEPKRAYEVVVENYGNFDKKITVQENTGEKSDTINIAPIGINSMPKSAIKLKNIQYEINSAELTASAKATLDTSLFVYLKENNDIIIEINSHTDNTGSDDFNLKLSVRRAQNVVKYLVSKGINSKRLISNGYGESKPIASNDTTEGRDLNRRTEFRIIGTLSKLKELEKED